MLGMVWCESCRGPRFKIPLRHEDDVPHVCPKCGGDDVSQRFVGENLAALRGALTDWVLGPEERRDPTAPIPARLKEIRRRFDAVVNTLEREESTHSPEWQAALREYRKIRKRPAHAPAAPAVADVPSSSSSRTPDSKPIDLVALHGLIEQGKADLADHSADQPAAPIPEPPRKRWGLFRKRAD